MVGPLTRVYRNSYLRGQQLLFQEACMTYHYILNGTCGRHVHVKKQKNKIVYQIDIFCVYFRSKAV